MIVSQLAIIVYISAFTCLTVGYLIATNAACGIGFTPEPLLQGSSDVSQNHGIQV